MEIDINTLKKSSQNIRVLGITSLFVLHSAWFYNQVASYHLQVMDVKNVEMIFNLYLMNLEGF